MSEQNTGCFQVIKPFLVLELGNVALIRAWSDVICEWHSELIVFGPQAHSNADSNTHFSQINCRLLYLDYSGNSLYSILGIKLGEILFIQNIKLLAKCRQSRPECQKQKLIQINLIKFNYFTLSSWKTE